MASEPTQIQPPQTIPTSPDVNASSPKANVDKPKASKVSKPPPGYKFVKVRKSTGEIVTVKRKLSPEELAASEAAQQNEAETTKASPTTNAPAKLKSSVSPTVPSTPASPLKSPLSDTTAVSATERPLEDPAVETPASEEALREQAQRFREKRRSGFRNKLVRGLATVVGHAVPSIGIGDMHDGDEIVDHDDDLSDDDVDDDDDDDGDNHGHDEHDHTSGHHDGTENHDIKLNTAVLANAAATSMTTKSPAPANANAPSTKSTEKKPFEKVTYNINVKELEKIEQEREKKDRPLKHHWANISFYFMASLSIVLPLLFLLLGLFIGLMNGQDASKGSSWHKMEQVIKIAISAWPIVFAAVVAQVFKAWATFKVERGVRLLELEQLLGSNSFGSAMKQPFLLRRLDLLTILLFFVWCLSPLGSQGLQRTYGKELKTQTDHTSVWILNSNGFNPMFSPGVNNPDGADLEDLNPTNYSSRIQLISIYWLSAFLPVSERDEVSGGYWQDRYDNPLIAIPYAPPSYNDTARASAFGLPISLPEPKFDVNEDESISDAIQNQLAWEDITFKTNASYFNFTCGNWGMKMGSQIPDDWSFSANQEMFMSMTDSVNNTPNFLGFASRNRDLRVVKSNLTDNSPGTQAPLFDPKGMEYSFIECTYDRVYVELLIECGRDSTSYGLPYCYTTVVNNKTVIKTPEASQNTSLIDFTFNWLENTAASSQDMLTSPLERYLNEGSLLDDPYSRDVDVAVHFALNETTTEDFQQYFSYAFNTWVNLGYCPECIDAQSYGHFYKEREPFYTNESSISYEYTTHYVYTLQVGWYVLYIVCTAILLLAGIFSVVIESMTVAPDVLGYVSTVARNSKYLHLPATNSAMSGGERARKIGQVEVMIQDVKSKSGVGRIVLGMKHEKAERLRADRLYR